jgi:hypothetical protein
MKHTDHFLIVPKERHHEIFIFAVHTIPDLAQRRFHDFITDDLLVMSILATIAFRFPVALWTRLAKGGSGDGVVTLLLASRTTGRRVWSGAFLFGTFFRAIGIAADAPFFFGY